MAFQPCALSQELYSFFYIFFEYNLLNFQEIVNFFWRVLYLKYFKFFEGFSRPFWAINKWKHFAHNTWSRLFFINGTRIWMWLVHGLWSDPDKVWKHGSRSISSFFCLKVRFGFSRNTRIQNSLKYYFVIFITRKTLVASINRIWWLDQMRISKIPFLE